MKQDMFLGLSKNKEKCCLLYSLADFEKLKKEKDNLTTMDFHHTSTDWGGCDDVERVIKLKNVSRTGDIIELKIPLIFTGEDYDCGHTDEWEFEVYYIERIKEKT